MQARAQAFASELARRRTVRDYAPTPIPDGVLDDCEFARGDFDLDGTVGGADLAVLLSLWSVTNAPFGDLDGDGQIGGADLAILLGNWGPY